MTYDLRLSRYYMWAQTARFVYLAVYVPTGYRDKALHVELTPRTLLLQPEDSPPVVKRALAFAVRSAQRGGFVLCTASEQSVNYRSCACG